MVTLGWGAVADSLDRAHRLNIQQTEGQFHCVRPNGTHCYCAVGWVLVDLLKFQTGQGNTLIGLGEVWEDNIQEDVFDIETERLLSYLMELNDNNSASFRELAIAARMFI